MKVAVLYNASSQADYREAENDTAKSAAAVADAIRRLPHTVELVEISGGSLDKIRQIKADCIFNYIEWTGRDLVLADRALELLEAGGIPFTGADRANYRQTTDKVLMKSLFTAQKIPTPRYTVFNDCPDWISPEITFPSFVKVSREHSGVGLADESKVKDAESLRQVVCRRIREFQQPVICEEYIDGRDVEVGLLETESGLEVLPPAENIFPADKKTRFLTYKSRWDPDQSNGIKTVVAKLAEKETAAIGRLCRRAFKKLHFQDYARFDLRLTPAGRIYMIETNSNPGIDAAPDNGLTVAFMAAGYTLSAFCSEIINSCMRRTNSKKAKKAAAG